MPKSTQFTKGSIVFFSGDKNEDIYILQSGAVILQSIDLETGERIEEPLKTGEFFGVKSSLAGMPSLVTAFVAADSVVVEMTSAEFEKIFSSKQAITEKMLRVFSRSLRDIHKKTETLLKGVEKEISSEEGMFIVAKSFFEEEYYKTAGDVLARIMNISTDKINKNDVLKLLEEAQTLEKKSINSFGPSNPTIQQKENTINQFSLPVFDRFTKNYKQGDLIISEYEPGESFYLIKSGEVQITKCINGHNKNLDILTTGAFFGEMAILDNSPRSASCIARTDVSCLEFNKANFKALVLSNPQIVMNLLKIFCKRIYDQYRQFKILLIKNLQARIADIFVMYDELAGTSKTKEDSTDKENESKRQFAITEKDIAGWAAKPQTEVHDELSRFIKLNKVDIYDDRIVVKNIHDMKRIVDSYYAKLSTEVEKKKPKTEEEQAAE